MALYPWARHPRTAEVRAFPIRSRAGTTALGTAVIGVVGVIIMVGGARAITAGTMTLGDLFMYLLFTGLLAAPVMGIASIGTQITEAFAGLDRIRETTRCKGLSRAPLIRLRHLLPIAVMLRWGEGY